MSIAQRLLRPLEVTVNRLLALDPETPARLRPLAGRSVLVELPEAGLSLRAEFHEQGLRLAQTDEAENSVDGSVRLPAKAAVSLARARGAQAQGVEFRGDVAVVHALRRLAGGLEIDWEDQLAKLLGDVLAHRVGLTFRSALGWLGQSRRTFEANVGEYLTEEAQQLPPKLEVAAFLNDIDALRQDCDRLQARIERLERGARLY